MILVIGGTGAIGRELIDRMKLPGAGVEGQSGSPIGPTTRM